MEACPPPVFSEKPHRPHGYGQRPYTLPGGSPHCPRGPCRSRSVPAQELGEMLGAKLAGIGSRLQEPEKAPAPKGQLRGKVTSNGLGCPNAPCYSGSGGGGAGPSKGGFVYTGSPQRPTYSPCLKETSVAEKGPHTLLGPCTARPPPQNLSCNSAVAAFLPLEQGGWNSRDPKPPGTARQIRWSSSSSLCLLRGKDTRRSQTSHHFIRQD